MVQIIQQSNKNLLGFLLNILQGEIIDFFFFTSVITSTLPRLCQLSQKLLSEEREQLLFSLNSILAYFKKYILYHVARFGFTCESLSLLEKTHYSRKEPVISEIHLTLAKLQYNVENYIFSGCRIWTDLLAIQHFCCKKKFDTPTLFFLN